MYIGRPLLPTPDGSHGVVFLNGVYESVVFFCAISKNASRITKLDMEMFHDESWKSIYFWVKRSSSRVTKKQCLRGSLHSCECWLLLC